MVSEDSLHRVAALAAAVHRLAKSQYCDIVRVRQASARQDRHRVPEALEVLGLGSNESEPLEEWHDAAADLAEVVDLPVPTAIAGFLIVPQPNVSRKSSNGALSFWETLKAAESFHLLP
jgi:hypothetical protein